MSRQAKSQGTSTVVWFTGLPSSGKSTLAQKVAMALRNGGTACVVLDGDDVRAALVPKPGYGEQQREELEQTINAADVDLVLIGTPIDLGRLLRITKPAVRVRYELGRSASEELRARIEKVMLLA